MNTHPFWILGRSGLSSALGVVESVLVGAGTQPLFLTYVGVFTLAAVGSFAGLLRLDRVTDPDVRRGLRWLLLTSGGWAAAHVGYLAAPTAALQNGFYAVGLIVGLAAVGPWLYLCSAYTGRSWHRNASVRRLAVVVFAGIVGIKLTNPIHGRYYSTTVASEPFPHLLVSHGPLHWVVMGLAYALATLGFFMLVELFFSIDEDVTPLAVLVGLTGLPVLTDVAGVASPAILEITYSPLGVAVFSIGVMFVYLDQFQKVQLAGNGGELAIFLDDENRIRDTSASAGDHFPELADAVGEDLSTVLPSVAEALERETSTLERHANGRSRYYHVTVNAFGGSGSASGSIVMLSDITERERYRKELERQNERLERFASIISHDLRNPLNVATLRLDSLDRRLEEDEDLDAARTALDRMEALIDDLLDLARHGQPIDETEQVLLSTVTRQAWEMVETGDTELVVETDTHVEADPERFQQLFENLFRNAMDHGGGITTVRVGELTDGNGFFVEDDGVGIPEENREEVLEFGYTTDQDGTGFGLAIVSEIANAHQWDLAVGESRDGGARFEIRTSGRTIRESDAGQAAARTTQLSSES